MASLYDSASLVMIPSGVKDGKVYSIKPTDGSGDFTFSRGTDTATRVNSSGLIEKERENLLLQSNQFDTTWEVRSGASQVTSGQPDKDGGNNAWLLSSISTGTYRYINQNTGTNALLTSSMYAKAGTASFIGSIDTKGFGTSNAWFDLANGTTGTINGSNIIHTSIESVGNGWYRLSYVTKAESGGGIAYWFIADADGSTNCSSGDNIYIQDAQLEQGLVATDYIETTTAAVYEGITDNLPRLDYSGGASCPSLLLEPSRTNSITQSEYFGAWTPNGLTITDNDETSPEGVSNAAKLTLPSGSATKRIALGSMPVTSVARSCSFFVKSDDITAVQLAHSGDLQGYARFDISSGVVGSKGSKTTSDIEDYGNGWYRCIANFDSTNAFGSTIYLYINDSASGSYGGSTSAEGDLFVYGAQYEVGSYPTSYIPTYGTSASRAFDSCFKTGISDLLNDSEGTLFLEMKGISDGGDSRRFTISNGSIDNRVSLEYDENAGRIKAFLSTGGTTTGALDESGHPQTDNHKIAITYTASAFKIFIDGVLEGSDTSLTGTPIGLDQIEFKSGSGNNPMEGLVKQALVFKTALTDAEAIALTTL